MIVRASIHHSTPPDKTEYMIENIIYQSLDPENIPLVLRFEENGGMYLWNNGVTYGYPESKRKIYKPGTVVTLTQE